MTFKTFVNNTLIGTIDYLIPVIFLLAIVVFMFGIVLYISRSGDAAKRKEGVRYMFYGIIGLAVMVSVWGLVQLLTGSLFGVPVLIPRL